MDCLQNQPGAELPAGRNIRPLLFPQIRALREKMHKRRKTPSCRCRARLFCSCEAQTVRTFLKVHAIQVRLSLHVFKLLNAAVLQLLQRFTHQNVRLVFLLWLLGFVQFLLFDTFSFFPATFENEWSSSNVLCRFKHFTAHFSCCSASASFLKGLRWLSGQ